LYCVSAIYDGITLQIILEQACSTHVSWAACCPLHSVMSPMEIFELREHILNLSVANLRWNAEAFVTTYKLYIYGDVHGITTLNTDTA
jgi:hypothetical protein